MHGSTGDGMPGYTALYELRATPYTRGMGQSH